MRSEHSQMLHRVVAMALAASVLAAARPSAQAQPGPTRAQVEAAADDVRKDPNLPGTRKEERLQLKPTEDEPPSRDELPSWLRSLAELMSGFARHLTDAARVLVWVTAAVGVVLLLVGLRHWAKVRAGPRRLRAGVAPSHVGVLDIRPETLPERIGDAALALWRQGEHRAALSLLYRGALSRGVHVHELPIRSASTEGDCLRMAQARLTPEAAGFFARLVGVWQRATYGAHLPDDEQVRALCDAFEPQLGRRRASVVAPPAGARP